MPPPSPLDSIHQQGDALFGDYGPAASPVRIVQAFDPIEIEYAAIRRHAAIIDLPQRATLVITGEDRLSFLNRMLTQELKTLPPYQSTRSFWLSRKGRIDADLRVINLPDRILFDVDVFAAERVLQTLGSYIITEDCRIADATDDHHRLALHGPAAAALVCRLSEPASPPAITDIQPNQVAITTIAGAQVIIDRIDSAGEIGLELLVPRAHVPAVYEKLSTPWPARASTALMAAPSTDLARRIGWHAYNIARLEAGTPLYLLDFGPDSLPHETGDQTLHDRVSFKKGCYLGQEIVARMNALGHPKQKLVALAIDPPAPASSAAIDSPQAVTGTAVVETDAPGAATIGAVTSSAFSPLRSGAPIALAMVKFSHAVAGREVWLQTDGARLRAVVQSQMNLLRK